jgi:hypothetical protein
MGMTPKQVERWAKTRKMGRTRYIWLSGVLVWGLTVGVLWAVTMTAMRGQWERLPIPLTIDVIGYSIGGYFFGLFTWKWSEKQYEEATRNNPSTE